MAERVLPAALFVAATASAAAKYPQLNGEWTNEGLVPAAAVDVAMAISLRAGGLVTPVIKNTDQQPLDGIMDSVRELVAGARSGSLRSSWMTAPSITVTNLGDNGADRVHGVVFPRQVALVGFGSVRERPIVRDGEVVATPTVRVSLAADHRATDGALGSKFLAAVAKHLTHPEEHHEG